MIAPTAPDDAPDETPEEPDPRALHRARVERHMAALAELTEVGMGIARLQGARALAAAEDSAPAKGPDPALVFAHMSRVVRQSIALEARLSEGLLVSLKEDEESPQAQFARMAAGAGERLRKQLRALALPQPGEEGYEEWVARGSDPDDWDDALWDAPRSPAEAFPLDGGRLDGGVAKGDGVTGEDGDVAEPRSSPQQGAFTPTPTAPPSKGTGFLEEAGFAGPSHPGPAPPPGDGARPP